MTRRIDNNGIAALVLCVAALLVCGASTGCDEGYVMPGDFMTPSVEPMGFSPYGYGYDYDMYDLYTEDI